MDVLSHGLWGGVVFGRENKRAFLCAVAFSVLPDLLSEGVLLLLVLLGAEGMPKFEGRHPNITEFPGYAQGFYDFTHSLVAFGLVSAAVCLLLRRIFRPLLAWGLHILIDIPTHSVALFPTPFLWPVSDFKINGIGWASPVILVPDIALLIVVYAIWVVRNAAGKSRACLRWAQPSS